MHGATGARVDKKRPFHGAQESRSRTGTRQGGKHRTSTDGYPSRDLDLASNLSLTSDIGIAFTAAVISTIYSQRYCSCRSRRRILFTCSGHSGIRMCEQEIN